VEGNRVEVDQVSTKLSCTQVDKNRYVDVVFKTRRVWPVFRSIAAPDTGPSVKRLQPVQQWLEDFI
jgi:hypothetical protein